MRVFYKKVIPVGFEKTISLIKVDMSFRFKYFYFLCLLYLSKNLNNLDHAIQEREAIYFLLKRIPLDLSLKNHTFCLLQILINLDVLKKNLFKIWFFQDYLIFIFNLICLLKFQGLLFLFEALEVFFLET